MEELIMEIRLIACWIIAGLFIIAGQISESRTGKFNYYLNSIAAVFMLGAALNVIFGD